jgi:hypothetical protein
MDIYEHVYMIESAAKVVFPYPTGTVLQEIKLNRVYRAANTGPDNCRVKTIYMLDVLLYK